jgi:hypothetical protein
MIISEQGDGFRLHPRKCRTFLIDATFALSQPEHGHGFGPFSAKWSLLSPRSRFSGFWDAVLWLTSRLLTLLPSIVYDGHCTGNMDIA